MPLELLFLIFLLLSGSSKSTSQPLKLMHVNSGQLNVLDSSALESLIECQAACVARPNCSFAIFDRTTKICQEIDPSSLAGLGTGSDKIYCSQVKCKEGNVFCNILYFMKWVINIQRGVVNTGPWNLSSSEARTVPSGIIIIHPYQLVPILVRNHCKFTELEHFKSHVPSFLCLGLI